MDALANVDVIIDETYAYLPRSYTFDTFLGNFGLNRSSPHKFVKNQMVLRIDGTISAADGLDWYESRIARPDWAVEGLARGIHGDASKRFKYFRNIAKDESIEVLTADACTVTLPSCDPSAVAKTIEMINKVTTTTLAAATTTPMSVTAAPEVTDFTRVASAVASVASVASVVSPVVLMLALSQTIL